MAPSKPTVMLWIANLFIPIAILTFASGFFPYKPFLPGLAKYEALGLGFGAPPKAPFDKVIFMVVDALRRYVIRGDPLNCYGKGASNVYSDFVFSNESAFAFTQRYVLLQQPK